MVSWRTFFRYKTEVCWSDGRNLKGCVEDLPQNQAKFAVMNFCNQIGEENIIAIDSFQNGNGPLEITVWYCYEPSLEEQYKDF